MNINIVFKTDNINYKPYIDNIISIYNNLPKLSEIQLIQSKLFNIPQIPLQPTKENLDIAVYNAFEMDQIKYEIYYLAFKSFLNKKKENYHKKSVNKEKLKIIDFVNDLLMENVLRILFIGPGKGGILKLIIKACQEEKINYAILAIEKNPFVFKLLENYLNVNKLENQVLLINEDIRKIEMKKFSDILISELIGSFGDNELSPELIASAEKFFIYLNIF